MQAPRQLEETVREVEFPLLSVATVAEYLAVSTRTVHRLITSGELEVFRVGSIIRLNEHDLLDYLSRNCGRY